MPTTGTIQGRGVGGGFQAGKTQIAYDWIGEETEENGPDGTRITAVVQTAYSEAIRTNFPSDMLGAHSINANKISRITPEPHPLRPWLFCTHCDLLNGIGYPNESGNKLEYLKVGATPGKLRWNCTWEDLGYDVKTDAEIATKGSGLAELDRYVARKSLGSQEALPIPSKAWKYSADNVKISEPTTIPLTVIGLEYAWNWVPEPLNEDAWLTLLNKTNSATFDSGNPSSSAYIAGTVLFTHYEKSDRVRDPQGNACRHVTFFFQVRYTLWNNFYRLDGASGPGFYAVVAEDGSGVRPFGLEDLNACFTP